MREQDAHAAEFESAFYGHRYEVLGLDRPSTASNPAPSHRPSLKAESGEPDKGIRYPVIGDYTSEASHFGFFDFRKLGATSSDEIAFAANWLGTQDGFCRVDPVWSKRKCDEVRRRQREHLERDSEGRALIQPVPLAALLLDYPDTTTHDVVRFVHDVVSIYCGPRGETRLAQWIPTLPRERWGEALWIHHHSTPKPRGGNGRRSIPTLIDYILQHGYREIVPDYRVEGTGVLRARKFAKSVNDAWLDRIVRPETKIVRPSRAAEARTAAARAAKINLTVGYDHEDTTSRVNC